MYDEALLKEMMSVPEIAQALELSKESAYTKQELEAYDKYWDMIRVEKTMIADAKAEGKAEGINIGEKKGIEIGEKRGSKLNALETAKKLKLQGLLDTNQIADVTGLSDDEINKL